MSVGKAKAFVEPSQAMHLSTGRIQPTVYNFHKFLLRSRCNFSAITITFTAHIQAARRGKKKVHCNQRRHTQQAKNDFVSSSHQFPCCNHKKLDSAARCFSCRISIIFASSSLWNALQNRIHWRFMIASRERHVYGEHQPQSDRDVVT